MGDLDRHLSEIVTVTIAIIGAFYGALKSSSAKKEQDFENRINKLSDNFEKMRENSVSVIDSHKMGSAITALMGSMTEIKLDTLRKTDKDEILLKVELLSKSLAGTREEIAHANAKDSAEDRSLQKQVERLQAQIDAILRIKS